MDAGRLRQRHEFRTGTSVPSWPSRADYDIVERSAEPTEGWYETPEAGRFVQTVPSPTGRQQ